MSADDPGRLDAWTPGDVNSQVPTIRLRLIGRWVLWLVTTGVLLLFWALMVDSALTVEAGVNDGNVVTATVVFAPDPDDDDGATQVEAGGRRRELVTFPPVWSIPDIVRAFDSGLYEVGDEIEVVLNSSGDAYDAASYRRFSWVEALLGLAFLGSVVATIRALFTRDWTLPDRARWQCWGLCRPRLATVVEVRAAAPPRGWRQRLSRWWGQAWEGDDEIPDAVHRLVIEVDGRVHYWEATAELESHTEGRWEARIWDPLVIEPGAQFHVVGSVRRGGWIVGLTDPELSPLAGLD